MIDGFSDRQTMDRFVRAVRPLAEGTSLAALKAAEDSGHFFRAGFNGSREFNDLFRVFRLEIGGRTLKMAVPCIITHYRNSVPYSSYVLLLIPAETELDPRFVSEYERWLLGENELRKLAKRKKPEPLPVREPPRLRLVPAPAV
jgi:hypothetical protein